MPDMKPVEIPPLAMRKLKSPGTRRVLEGLRRAADANGLPQDGRFIDYSDTANRNTVVLGAAPGHTGESSYLAAFPTAAPTTKE